MLSIPKNIFESIDKPGRQQGEPNQLDNLNELLDLLDLQVILLQPGKELFTPWCARIDQAGRMEKSSRFPARLTTLYLLRESPRITSTCFIQSATELSQESIQANVKTQF